MNGVNLEKQVKNILEKNDWEVLSNLYYKDPITKKPREKDIIATSLQFKNNDILCYNAKLFIECKYLPSETEIHLENINMNEIENTVLNYNISSTEISEIERSKKFHFYSYTEVFGAKDSKDHLYKAINQNLQSFDAFRKSTSEKGVYYLIVVYDGKLKSAGKDYNSALIKIETIDNVFNLPKGGCFIELVSVNQFENLIKKIEEDIKEINSSIHFYYKMEKNRINKNRRNIKNDQYYIL